MRTISASSGPAADPPLLVGSVTYLVSDEDLMAPIDGAWDADPLAQAHGAPIVTLDRVLRGQDATTTIW